MTLLLSIAIIVGVLQAYGSMNAAKNGTGAGVSPSSSLIEFVFLNK